MTKQEIRNKTLFIKNRLAKFDIDRSIDLMKKFALKSSEKQLFNEVIIVSSQFEKYKNEIQLNINDNDQLRNKCIRSFLSILDRIEENLLENFISEEKQGYPNYNNFFLDKYKPVDLQLNDKTQISKAICLFSFEFLKRPIEKIADINMDLSQSKDFQNWLKTKRKFISEEILNSTILKISITGTALKVEFNKNFTLEEGSIHTKYSHFKENKKENLTWNGTWHLGDGVLNMIVDKYNLDIIATKGNLVHIGVEFVGTERIYYHEIFQIPFARKYSNYKWK